MKDCCCSKGRSERVGEFALEVHVFLFHVQVDPMPMLALKWYYINKLNNSDKRMAIDVLLLKACRTSYWTYQRRERSSECIFIDIYYFEDLLA